MIKIKIAAIVFLTVLNALVFQAYHQQNPSKARSIASRTKTIADINFRRNFLSLEHSHGYRGLFHNGNDSEYITRLFGQIIQAADELAREDWYHPEESIYNHYHLFLLLSLVVPSHESALMHFTLREKAKYCYFFNDVLDPMEAKDNVADFYKKALMQLDSADKGYAKTKRRYESKIRNANFLTTYYPIFEKAKGGKKLEVKNCDKINTSEVYQLMFSGDYADVGMFMINAKSHGDFFAEGGILNFDTMKDYALEFLYSGFKRISLNNDSYSCLAGLQISDPDLYAQNILKGSWAGRYNSGNTGKTCRFMNPNDKFSANDVSYARSLKKFFEPEGRKISLFEKFLPLESIERKAFVELMDNVKNQTNNQVYLAQVLKTDYQSESNHILTNENDIPLLAGNGDFVEEIAVETKIDISELPDAGYQEFNFPQLSTDNLSTFIVSRNVNIRLNPAIQADNLCGNTRKATVAPVEVNVLEQEGSWLKVASSGLGEILDDHCQELTEVYVHESLVKMLHVSKEKEHIEFLKIIPVYKGLQSSTVVGVIGPGQSYLKLSQKTKDQSTWVQILTASGKKAWVNTGVNTNEVFKRL